MNQQPAEAYPLYWPAGRPRTPGHRRQRSKFETTFARARDDLFRELKLLGATLPVLSTNVSLRRDGLPLAGQRQPEDPGVAVYFTRNKRQVCFACDRWTTVEDNVWAVCKTIDALRGIARWGTGDMIDAAFTGFQALPDRPGSANGQSSRPWWDVLGTNPEVDRYFVESRYAALAREHHPDRGGDPAKMAEVNAAMDEFRRQRGA
jgi:hypothetical protein